MCIKFQASGGNFAERYAQFSKENISSSCTEEIKKKLEQQRVKFPEKYMNEIHKPYTYLIYAYFVSQILSSKPNILFL